MSSEKERQGDFVFTAKETGEYRFCFDNDMSTFAEKLVDFEIAVWSSFIFPLLFAFRMRWPCQNIGALLRFRNHTSAYRGDCHLLTSSLYLRAPKVENEARAELPSKQGTSPEQTSALEESIYKLSGQLSTINRMQKYFRTRENRNFSTVKSTESRIFNFSVVESGLMVCMAGLQVFIVRFFFQGARKGRLPYSQRGGVWGGLRWHLMMQDMFELGSSEKFFVIELSLHMVVIARRFGELYAFAECIQLSQFQSPSCYFGLPISSSTARASHCLNLSQLN